MPFAAPYRSRSPSPSLPESYRTVVVPSSGNRFRRFLAFAGPGYLVAVGYMDPGNWATDLAAGSRFGYSLLWVILLANAIAVLLQGLSARLGIAAGRDLAQACRERYSRGSVLAQWMLCELAICAADLAEVIGTAIALHLLFRIPLAWGVGLTALDVLIVLGVQRFGFRYLEGAVLALILGIFACFAISLGLVHPEWPEVARGFVPGPGLMREAGMLCVAIGIVGATVMPHNLYLHSSIVQTRQFARDDGGRRHAYRFASLDSAVALTLAFVVNCAILMLASAAFHRPCHAQIVGIEDAYHLLTPLLGGGLASALFAVALLASGQSSAITATLAGQIVMEGFTRFRLSGWKRRLLTRSIALVPAFVAVLIFGAGGLVKLLIFSQIVLSLQLPFAAWPLIRLTADPKLMGKLVAPRWITALGWASLTLIIALDFGLVYLIGTVDVRPR